MSRASNAANLRRPGWVLCLLLVMIAVRGGALIRLADSFVEDPDAYRRIAWTLDQTGTYGLKFGDGAANPTAYRPPLYPWLLSWLVTDTDDAETSLPAIRVGLLHLLAISVTLLAVYRTGVRLLDRRAALGACVLVTVDPLLIRHSSLVMTETIAVMLTSLATWWFVVMVQQTGVPVSGTSKTHETTLQRLAPWGLAITLAIDFLCRPTFLVWSGLLGIACLSRRPFRRAGLAIGLVMLTTVGLWTARNMQAVGHPVWATTHGGYTMLLPNNRFFYDYLRDGWSWTAWNAEPFTQAYLDRHKPSVQGPSANGQGSSLRNTWDIDATVPVIRYEDGEVANDRWAGQLARSTIQENPAMFVWSSLIRVMRLWSPIPLWTSNRSTTGILAVGLFYSVIYLAIVVSILKHRRRLFQFSWLPIWTLVIALTMVHSIYWTNLRMRCPVQPGLALVAAAALVRRDEVRVDS